MIPSWTPNVDESIYRITKSALVPCRATAGTQKDPQSLE